eukprot:CAMPEP_0177713964 /NCGR_PEP_ID=MMETSP0484_2-20121128/13215_1 /TAXON_ID=354590 /ORGANISM="Rhodomonas lens, Strain RHODO" /LENGTH=357 /DNA_ID=CAMNT_0019225879 /DNA_START=501 /DNA_END=1574 /DNA_ORIENTATION=+
MKAGLFNDKLQRQYIRWSTLRDILASHLPPGTISYGAEVSQVETSAQAVRVTSAATSQTAEAAVVIGADGLRSVMKRLMDPTSPPPQNADAFTPHKLSSNEPQLRGLGRTNIRGVLEDDSVLPRKMPPVTWQKVTAGQMVQITVSPAGCQYWSLSLLDSEATEHGWERAHVLASGEQAKSEAARLTEGFPELRALVQATPAACVVPYQSFVGDLVDSMAVGPVAVLGDAAHPAAVTGEGANMVLEDAAALALAFRTRAAAGPDGRLAVGTEEARSILQAFSSTRLPICSLIRDISLRSADAWLQGPDYAHIPALLDQLRPPFRPEATPESVAQDMAERRARFKELTGSLAEEEEAWE